MRIVIIQFVNYTLSFFMWMILGRLIFTQIFGERDTAVSGIFKKVTDPVYRLTKKIVPMVTEKWVPALTIVLLIVLRLVIIIISRPTTIP